MSILIDSLNMVKNNDDKIKTRVSTQTDSLVFEPKQEEIADTYTTKQVGKAEKKDESKNSSAKKWLIAAGITLGVVALGTAVYCLTKKTPTKSMENLSGTIAGDLPETLAKCDDFNVFKDLKMCKNLTLEEKEEIFKPLFQKPDRKNIFLATLSGDKPMTIISKNELGDDFGGNTLEILKKMDFGSNIETFDSISRISEKHRFWSKFFVNKQKLLEVIEKNRDIYVARLNLSQNASTQEIYNKFFNSVIKDNNLYMEDLLGIALGYPKMDAMFYQLEQAGNLSKRRYFVDFPDLLIDFFKSDNSPYKNLNAESLKDLEEELIKFKKKYGLASVFTQKGYSDTLYTFVNYTNNADEINRVKTSTDEFLKRFYSASNV